MALGADPKQASNWIMGQVLGQLSAQGLEAKDMALTPPTLARLIQLVQEGKLNRNTAVKVFEAVFETDGDVDAYVAEHGLEQVSDAGLVAQAVEQVLCRQPQERGGLPVRQGEGLRLPGGAGHAPAQRAGPLPRWSTRPYVGCWRRSEHAFPKCKNIPRTKVRGICVYLPRTVQVRVCPSTVQVRVVLPGPA